MSETASDENLSKSIRRLRYQDELNPVMDVIDKEYQTFDGPVYRTVCHIPPETLDITPQSKRKDSSNQGEALQAPMDDQMATQLEKETIKHKRAYIGSLAISVFKSQEQLLEDALKQYNKILQKYGVDEAKAYLTYKRGKYIHQINVNNIGIISKFENSGHANLLLYEDVTQEDIYDASFNPIEINLDDGREKDEHNA